MNWQQFLTEKVLHEKLWPNKPERCVNCRGLDCDDCADNRTFDNRNDLMDLYQKVYEDGKWTELVEYLNNLWWIKYGRSYDTVDEAIADYNAWLFCLNGKDYEPHCKMVAEFYGWVGK